MNDDSSTGNNHERYQVVKDRPADVIYQRVTQAHALAKVIVGDGFDSFKCRADDLQHEYLWALSALLDDAAVALKHQTEAALTGSVSHG